MTLLALLALALILDSGIFDSGDGADGTVKREAEEPAPSAQTEERETNGIALPAALGQMMVARFTGSNPSPAFLARIERGEVGGVILFEENLEGGEVAVARRVQRLRDAAESGGNPPLLILVDQEGGTVKRLPGPPHSSAAAMSDSDDAREQGEATGNLLRRLGINVDLAPVADVRHPGSFIGSRSFASSAEEVAELACAFAEGLRSQGVAATLKHFPGLGLATANTDEAIVTIDAPVEEVRADYDPYSACADEPLTLVMVDSAIYPVLSDNEPAVLSPLTYGRELPRAGIEAVTISDDLETPAIQAQTTPGRRSINAGLDLLLYARTESTSSDAYARLLEDARSGAISPAKVQSAAARILALKEQLG